MAINHIENLAFTIISSAKTLGLPQTGDTLPYLPDDGFNQLLGTDLGNGLVILDGTNEYVRVEVPKSVTASSGTIEEIENALIKCASSIYSGRDEYYSSISRKEFLLP